MKRNVLEYLEKNVKINPEKIAVEDEDRYLRYSELYDISRNIGSALLSKTVPRKPIAVFMEKSVLTVCTFLGIVQAGCYYALLNPELPSVRICQIQKILKAQYVITDTANYEKATEFADKEQILLIEQLMTNPVREVKLTEIRKLVIDTDPLYVNFTSGSAGTPKGVVVSHRSVLDFIDCFTDTFHINTNDVIGNQAPFDFDVSVKDIYICLKTGARLVIIPRLFFSKPVLLMDFLCEHKISIMIWAVSAVGLINTFHGLDYRTPFSVRYVFFSGEVMPWKVLCSWMEHLPGTKFVNLYGPTEITCNCTYHCIDRKRDYENGIPIGKPFLNEDVFLLNSKDQIITSSNETGEICVRGSALALGYLNNAEQTTKTFVQNPLNSCYPEKIYRTGDLAYYNENSELFFCGRKDFQIKYMGHRIEIEEIEHTISKIEGIERCCVTFDRETEKLYGFYIGSIGHKELHAKLTNILPRYMIPGAWYQLPFFPLTKNGKTDRNALLNMRTSTGKDKSNERKNY